MDDYERGEQDGLNDGYTGASPRNIKHESLKYQQGYLAGYDAGDSDWTEAAYYDHRDYFGGNPSYL